jgi:hypothetical protein
MYRQVKVAEAPAPKSNRSALRRPRHSSLVMQRTTASAQPQPESAMASNTSREQVQESSRSSEQQEGPAPKASNEQVWYLKSIDFTSPSGETRTYNVITQNYNGCAVSLYYSIFLARGMHVLTL